MQITKELNKIRGKEQGEATAKGTHIFTLCDAQSEKAQDFSHQLEFIRIKRERVLIRRDIEIGELMIQGAPIEEIKKVHIEARNILHDLWEEYKFHLDRLHRKFKKNEVVLENITCTVGRAVLCQRLGGDTTYTGTVTHTALGSDNTAAVVGDATLGTETYRKALSSGADSNNITYLETFFTAAEVTGTFEEYGMFIDGTGSADTGQLFNRFLSSITKSAVETLNIQSIITMANG